MDKEQGGRPQTFEERLRAARERQGLEPKPPTQGEGQGGEPSALAIGLRVAVELVVALVVACAIGWGLDQLLGTRPIFLIAFVPLGAAAGILNLWRMFAPGKDDSGRRL
jgi:ATP synthase protein I